MVDDSGAGRRRHPLTPELRRGEINYQQRTAMGRRVEPIVSECAMCKKCGKSEGYVRRQVEYQRAYFTENGIYEMNEPTGEFKESTIFECCTCGAKFRKKPWLANARQNALRADDGEE